MEITTTLRNGTEVLLEINKAEYYGGYAGCFNHAADDCEIDILDFDIYYTCLDGTEVLDEKQRLEPFIDWEDVEEKAIEKYSDF